MANVDCHQCSFRAHLLFLPPPFLAELHPLGEAGGLQALGAWFSTYERSPWELNCRWARTYPQLRRIQTVSKAAKRCGSSDSRYRRRSAMRQRPTYRPPLKWSRENLSCFHLNAATVGAQAQRIGRRLSRASVIRCGENLNAQLTFLAAPESNTSRRKLRQQTFCRRLFDHYYYPARRAVCCTPFC